LLLHPVAGPIKTARRAECRLVEFDYACYLRTSVPTMCSGDEDLFHILMWNYRLTIFYGVKEKRAAPW
jgi:hypothetical protein